jgi:hypothetical protein
MPAFRHAGFEIERGKNDGRFYEITRVPRQAPDPSEASDAPAGKDFRPTHRTDTSAFDPSTDTYESGLHDPPAACRATSDPSVRADPSVRVREKPSHDAASDTPDASDTCGGTLHDLVEGEL